MEIAPSTLVSLLLVLFLLSSPAAVPTAMARPGVDGLTPAAAPSALAPGADEHASDRDVYIVFVSRTDYTDSADYDVRLLASVVGSTEEAKKAMIYHYSGLGFAARLKSTEADQLSRKEGIATFKDKTYYVDKDGRLPRFFEGECLKIICLLNCYHHDLKHVTMESFVPTVKFVLYPERTKASKSSS